MNVGKEGRGKKKRISFRGDYIVPSRCNCVTATWRWRLPRKLQLGPSRCFIFFPYTMKKYISLTMWKLLIERKSCFNMFLFFPFKWQQKTCGINIYRWRYHLGSLAQRHNFGTLNFVQSVSIDNVGSSMSSALTPCTY